MSGTESGLACRLLAATACCYGSDDHSGATADASYDHAEFLSTPKRFSDGTDNGNACLVGVSRDGIVVAIRGGLPPMIDNLRNLLAWVVDLDTRQLSVDGLEGGVHGGFYSALQSVWQPMLAEVRRLLADGELPLYLTGHSKGGAMAVLAAAQLSALEGVAVTGVYTFAAPRPGNQAFADFFSALPFDTFRYEFTDDIVPHLPPSGTALSLLSYIPTLGKYFSAMEQTDFVSVGRLRYIDWQGHVTEDTGLMLEGERIYELSNLLTNGDFAAIGEAHSHLGGYCLALGGRVVTSPRNLTVAMLSQVFVHDDGGGDTDVEALYRA